MDSRVSTASEFVHKVILVTGSTSGIGREAAVTFARLGAQVVVTGRDSQRLADVALQCARDSPFKCEPLALPADVSDEKQTKSLLDAVEKEFGGIDVLVNNAGVFRLSGIWSPNLLEDFDKVIATNVRAVLSFCHLALPLLLKRRGCIVNVSSISALRPVPSALAYSIAKSGLDVLTRCLAVELGPLGVRVNAVNPGVVKTDLFKQLGMAEKTVEMFLDYVGQTYPLRRHGLASDVAEAIVFLASSSRASFITGVSLQVDGGALYASTTSAALAAHETQPGSLADESEAQRGKALNELEKPPVRYRSHL